MRPSKRNSGLIGILAAGLIWCCMPGHAVADTCKCFSPCKGSRTCPDGCWAFCEERESGPYCAKGCSYDVSAMTNNETIRYQGKLNSVDIKLPREQVKQLLERIFGVPLISTPAASASKTDIVAVKLNNTNLEGILDALRGQGVVLQIKRN